MNRFYIIVAPILFGLVGCGHSLDEQCQEFLARKLPENGWGEHNKFELQNTNEGIAEYIIYRRDYNNTPRVFCTVNDEVGQIMYSLERSDVKHFKLFARDIELEKKKAEAERKRLDEEHKEFISVFGENLDFEGQIKKAAINGYNAQHGKNITEAETVFSGYMSDRRVGIFITTFSDGEHLKVYIGVGENGNITYSNDLNSFE